MAKKEKIKKRNKKARSWFIPGLIALTLAGALCTLSRITKQKTSSIYIERTAELKRGISLAEKWQTSYSKEGIEITPKFFEKIRAELDKKYEKPERYKTEVENFLKIPIPENYTLGVFAWFWNNNTGATDLIAPEEVSKLSNLSFSLLHNLNIEDNLAEKLLAASVFLSQRDLIPIEEKENPETLKKFLEKLRKETGDCFEYSCLAMNYYIYASNLYKKPELLPLVRNTMGITIDKITGEGRGHSWLEFLRDKWKIVEVFQTDKIGKTAPFPSNLELKVMKQESSPAIYIGLFSNRAFPIEKGIGVRMYYHRFPKY